jgi:hypothetical protein
VKAGFIENTISVSQLNKEQTLSQHNDVDYTTITRVLRVLLDTKRDGQLRIDTSKLKLTNQNILKTIM